MANINVLSFEIANLIAAGEVVERPSSVLKELIENAIDAGSTEIVAEIKHGGVSLIRVSDNGCGMEKEDLPIALKRHATSKIRDKEDLASIMTLGFRGEALAAISSVSNVTIITKTKSAATGSMLVAEAGKVVDLSEVGAADGTTVVVENLFYNVPARRKFLKKDATEAMNVSALVEKVALSRPDISIQLLVDGEEKFRTPGNGELLDTLAALFGRPFAAKMIAVDAETDGIRVSGYIGRSDNTRKNRNLENVFINGRYVKSLTAQAAIEKAYTSYIAPEAFPVTALLLSMSPNVVDVNVHPAKLEVKFSDERRVFEAVYYAVKAAIESAEYRPELALGAKKSERNPLAAFVPIGEDTKGEQIRIDTPKREGFAPAAPKKETYPPYVREPRSAQKRDAEDRPLRVASGAGENFFPKKSEPIAKKEAMSPKDSVELLRRYGHAAEPDETPKTPASEKDTPKPPEYRYVGEAFDTYVFIEFEGDLLVIDKHAAHERVIFEDLKKSRKKDGRIASQSLLLPITVIPTADELSVAGEFAEDLRAVGFDFTVGEKSIDVIAIPDAVTAEDAETLFVRMIDELAEGRGNPQNTEELRRERALYQVACKAAIKGGRNYDRAVIEWLIGKLLLIPDITVCPHGRPVAYKMKKSDLDKQFDRIK